MDGLEDELIVLVDCSRGETYQAITPSYDRPSSSSCVLKPCHQPHSGCSNSTPGKFRVIVDLSAPAHSNVTDNIHRDLTHVTYSSINDAALLMHHFREAFPDGQDRYPRCLQANPNPPYGSQLLGCDVAGYMWTASSPLATLLPLLCSAPSPKHEWIFWS